MHETHLIKPIIEGIEAHAKKEGGKRVSTVRLKIGQFLGIKEDSFRETFAVLVQGTMLQDAQLELTSFPAYRIEVVSFDID